MQIFSYTPFTAKEKAEIERLKEEERQKRNWEAGKTGAGKGSGRQKHENWQMKPRNRRNVHRKKPWKP